MSRRNVRELDCRMTQNVVEHYYNNQPYTGIVYEMFKGYVDVEYEVVNGAKHGVETEYSSTGAVRAKRLYEDDLLQGVTEVYHPNGNVAEKSVFYKGVCVEAWVYDENNRLTEEYKIDESSPEYSWYQHLKNN